MSDFVGSLVAGLISPAALLAAAALFRNKLLDYFFTARIERIKSGLASELETHKGEIARLIELRKGEVGAALETLKSDLSAALESHKAALQHETRILEATLKRGEETYRAALEFGSAVDVDLRQTRTTAYKELWKLTSVLPRWPRNDKLTYADLKDFSIAMRTWYFDGGGLFLSERSMKSYNELQEKLSDVLGDMDEGRLQQIVQGAGSRDLSCHYDIVRLKCSKLRTSLTNDVLSRRAAPIAQRQDAGDRLPAQ